jgi:hypothetical protein
LQGALPIVVRRIASFSLLGALLVPAMTTASASATTACPTYDFATLFYEDYYPDTKWDNSIGAGVIRWAPVASGVIQGDTVTRPFDAAELDVVRSAFASFDAALDTIAFREVPLERAEITIGWVSLSVSGVDGYWNAYSSARRLRNRATIRLAASSNFLVSSPEALRHGVQHELGNVLGLGDILPNPSFDSVQEDPWQTPYGPLTLSDFDRGMIRQLYGETTCHDAIVEPTTTTTTLPSRTLSGKRCQRVGALRKIENKTYVCRKTSNQPTWRDQT